MHLLLICGVISFENGRQHKLEEVGGETGIENSEDFLAIYVNLVRLIFSRFMHVIKMFKIGEENYFFFSLIVDYCTKSSGHKGYANVLTELRIYLGFTGRGIMLLKLGFTIRCLIYLTNLSGIASWVSLNKEGC